MPEANAHGLPRQFGKYLLFDRIGAGGMAEIYLARVEDSLGGVRRMVIKEILPHLSADEGFAKMLVAEAKLAARLRHANVVQVIDLGREESRLYIAMEYVEGFDLNALLRRLSKRKIGLPYEFALLVVREVLAALDYAHRAKDESGNALGIVHRDVSPSNVLISMEGEVKLCDFGIARALGEQSDDALQKTGEGKSHLIGKSAYMSPEHARGEAIDARADVFAAGILLWELSAGKRLYKGTEDEMLRMAKEGDVPALPENRLPHQADLQAILDKALARDRDQRFASAADMMKALDGYIASSKQFASQLKFGNFLVDHFAEEVIDARAEREVTAQFSILPPSIGGAPPVTLAVPTEVASSTPASEKADTTSEPAAKSESEAKAKPDPKSEAPAKPTDRGTNALMIALGLLVLLSAAYFFLRR